MNSKVGLALILPAAHNTNPAVSVDVTHHENERKKKRHQSLRAQELCEKGGGPGPSFPIPFFPPPPTQTMLSMWT